ncbi:hypothetical protein ABG768_024052 [Culter alburnus]|uniref:Uncharacterized protein n=1 Tax=Culter alburnus TaxID=194366 RepID=A0AAW2AKH2_CULAL
MATWSLRVWRIIFPQWGQSDPPSATSVWVRPRQKTHVSWPSEGSEPITKGHLYLKAHQNTAGDEKTLSAAACRSR